MNEIEPKEDTLRRRAEALLQLPSENTKDLNAEELRRLVHELHVHRIELEMQNEELRETQKALSRSQKRYATLYNQAPVGHVALDHSGIIKHANTTFASMLNRDADSLQGEAFTKFMTPESESIFRSRLRALLKNPFGKQMDLEFKAHNKKNFHASLRALALEEADPQPEAETKELLVTISDISDRKKLDAYQEKGRKMETIATLSGGIAHDYNNLLSAILGNVELLKLETEQGSARAKLLDEVENASLKARELTHQFLILARGGIPAREVGSLKGLIQRIVEDIPKPSQILVNLRLEEDLWPANYNLQQIYTALRNVLINAAEAMPNGGLLTVQAQNVPLADSGECGDLSLKKGDYVKIEIQDSGTGIPDEILPHIFDPYFSTKDTPWKKGTGMGLATADAIIRKHNGAIAAASLPGEGTRFTIYLPAEPENKTVKTDPEPAIGLTGIKRVLVMDDEKSLRNLVSSMLNRLSIHSETVINGEEALRVYGRHMAAGKPFDAVILDLTIKEGMGAVETMKELLRLDPGVKAIISSGYFDHAAMISFKEYGFCHALPKPYQKQDLENALKTVIKERA